MTDKGGYQPCDKPMTPTTKESAEKVERKLPKIFRLMKYRYPITKDINEHCAHRVGIWELIGWSDLDKPDPTMTLRAFHVSCPEPQIEETYHPETWITFEKIEWKEDQTYAPKP